MSNGLHLHICPVYKKHDLAERTAEAAYKAALAEEAQADGHHSHWQERVDNVELAVREGLTTARVREEVEKSRIAAHDAGAVAVKAKLALADARDARLECIENAEQQVADVARKRLADIRGRQESAREALARAIADEVALFDEVTSAVYFANGGVRGARYYLGATLAEGIR